MITKEQLEEVYIKQNKTRNETAIHFGVKPRYIKFLTEKYNLKKTSDMIRKNNKGKHTLGLHWFNNGKIQICAKECPEGFIKGTLEKTRNKHKGKRCFSEDSRQKLSNCATSRFKGKHISEKHKQKISSYYKTHVNPKKGVPRTEDVKRKISQKLKGHKQASPIRDKVFALNKEECLSHLTSENFIDFAGLYAKLGLKGDEHVWQLIQKHFLNLGIEFKKYTSTSLFEKEVLECVRNIFKGTIICNEKHLMYPHELDIYLPELRLGIECNGCYWHCSEILGKLTESNCKFKAKTITNKNKKKPLRKMLPYLMFGKIYG